MAEPHAAGNPMEALGLAITLQKELERDQYGNPALDPDGKKKYRCGFRVGGGIDQDNTKSPQGYPDRGLYITHIYDNSPAAQAGLLVHDKILQVNGIDFTMLTHEKACKYIRKDAVLNMIVHRKGMPSASQSSHYSMTPSDKPVTYASYGPNPMTAGPPYAVSGPVMQGYGSQRGY